MDSVCYYLVEEKKTSPMRISLGLGMCAAVFAMLSMQFSTLAQATGSVVTSPVTTPITWPIIDPVISPPVTSPVTTPVITIPPVTNTNPGNNGSNNSTNNNSGSTNNASSNTQTCTDTTPAAPRLFQIRTTDTTATLYLTPMSSQTSGYSVSYGSKATSMQFGITFPQSGAKEAVTYTINKLSPNKTYFFSVKAINGCQTGASSNILKATTTTTKLSKPRFTTAWEQMRLLVLSWIR